MNKMIQTIAIPLVLLLFTCRHIDTVQLFTEEKTELKFFCPPFNFSTIEFYLFKNNIENRIYNCDYLAPVCASVLGGVAEFNTSGSHFPFNSTNLTERRSIKGFMCVFINATMQLNYTEDVQIIAKAQGVHCFKERLTFNNEDISITCMTSKIYPPAYCNFDVSNKVSGHISYSHVHYIDTVDYYQSNCTWTSALHNFYAGNYTLDVSFYPNVTNDTNFATNVSTSFEFTVPNIHLSRYCFNGNNIMNGYVRPGATAECICYLDSTGYPPAFLQWSNSSNVDLGNHLNNTAIALPIEPYNNLVTYNCSRVTNLQNGNESTFYTVNYARDPTNCSVELKDVRTIWKICKSMPIKLAVTCQVNQDDAMPGIKAKIFTNSHYSDISYSQLVNKVYRVEHEINITNSGNYCIGCQVQNILFSDVNVTCNYSSILQVMAPPVTAPVIQIRSVTTEYVNTFEDKIYTIECRALGGMPPVSNITVSCGNIEELTQSGNIFTSQVTFTRSMTGQNCTCTAQHITGCYENNTSTLRTNVLYKSAVTYFNVTSPVIDNGKSAQIHCEADGNPAPNITLLKGGEIIAQTSSGYILFYNNLITCKDAGNYVCQVNNGIDFNKESHQITLLVRCPLQFNTDERFKNFSLSQGEPFSYDFTVYGYPEPNKFTVFKTKRDLNNVEVTKSSTEPPYVTIKLKILSLTSKDFDTYILVIHQNGTQSLTYTFTIEEVDLKETSINVAAIVGGSIAACVVVILIIAVILVKRKYEIKIKLICRVKESEPTTKDETTYSELSMSQQQKENHNYEEPTYNRNVYNNVEMDTTTQYVNVNVKKDIIVSKDESSIYCNTHIENIHSPV